MAFRPIKSHRLSVSTVSLYYHKVAVGRVAVGSARIKFWDLGGQSELQQIWEKYYKECHGIIFVIDACDAERLDECQETFGSEGLVNERR